MYAGAWRLLDILSTAPAIVTRRPVAPLPRRAISATA
jgi:hypothetical protein